MSGRLLCHLDDVPDGGARVVTVERDDGGVAAVIVVRREGHAWAYVNRCPHFSVGLDFQPGRILTWRSQVLMCAHHSAIFRFEDGICIDGPCKGARLDGVEIKINEATSEISGEMDRVISGQ